MNSLELQQIITNYQKLLAEIGDLFRLIDLLLYKSKLFNSFIDSANDLTTLHDLEANLKYVSPSARTFLQYDPEELVGKCGFRFVHPEDRHRTKDFLRRIVQESKSGSIRYRLVKKDGNSIWVESQAKVGRYDSDNKAESLLMISRDISREVSINRHLVESEQRYRVLAESTSEGICITENGIIIDANEQFANMLGYELKDVIGRDELDFVIEQDREVVLDRVGKLDETPYDLRLQSKTGEIIDVEIRAKSMVYKKKQVRITILHDLSERKRMEDILKRNELLYRTMLESSFDGILISKKESVLNANNGLIKRLGYDNLEEIQGKNLLDFVKPEFIETAKEKLKQSIAEPYVIHLIEKNGNIKIFQTQASEVQLSDTEKVRISVFNDITSNVEERKRLKHVYHQIEKSRDDHLSMLNMLRQAIVTLDPDERIIFMNKAAQKLLRKDCLESFGRHWSQLFCCRHEGLSFLEKELNQPTGTPMQIEITLQSEEKTRYFLEIEVRNDPRDKFRKILFFSEVFEVGSSSELPQDKLAFQGIIGQSAPIQKVFCDMRQIAKVDWTVLIEGETGTGKELVARGIHALSARKKQPFVPINSSALSDEILSSQLFGHRRGAFSGAVNDQEGLFEAAKNGTLFLDEIGDISIKMQTSLLRTLEEKEITRIGETKPRIFDTRIIAATNHDLRNDVANNAFREDLYYRLQIARIKLPPLRERREDIGDLAFHFLETLPTANETAIINFHKQVLDIFHEYPWPGNIRELKNAIAHAKLHCSGKIILPEHLPTDILHDESIFVAQSRIAKPKNQEAQRLIEALRKTNGNRSAAAKLLGIGRTTLYEWMKRHNISNAY